MTRHPGHTGATPSFTRSTVNPEFRGTQNYYNVGNSGVSSHAEHYPNKATEDLTETLGQQTSGITRIGPAGGTDDLINGVSSNVPPAQRLQCRVRGACGDPIQWKQLSKSSTTVDERGPVRTSNGQPLTRKTEGLSGTTVRLNTRRRTAVRCGRSCSSPGFSWSPPPADLRIRLGLVPADPLDESERAIRE